jgi:hypothetical protein
MEKQGGTWANSILIKQTFPQLEELTPLHSLFSIKLALLFKTLTYMVGDGKSHRFPYFSYISVMNR